MNTKKLTKQATAVNLLGTMGAACLLFGLTTVLIWVMDDPDYVELMIGWAVIYLICALILFFVLTVVRNVAIRKKIKNLEQAAGVSFDESPFCALSANVDVSDNWIVIGQDSGRVILPKNSIENLETTDPEGQRRKSIIRIFTTLRKTPVSLIADRNLDPGVFEKMKDWAGITDIPAVRVCPFCGTEQEADARFCTECGRELGEYVPQPTVAKPVAPVRNVVPEEETPNSNRKVLIIVSLIAVVILLFLFLTGAFDRSDSRRGTGKMVYVPVAEVM